MGMDLERTHGQSTVRYVGITAVSYKGVMLNCAMKWQQNCVMKSTLQHLSILVCQCVHAIQMKFITVLDPFSLSTNIRMVVPPFEEY